MTRESSRTPKLAGRDEPQLQHSFAHESRAIRAPVELVVRRGASYALEPTILHLNSQL
jgi:hypothetical protein